eukprot:1555413-Pyramimonas_sp.AAC.1
MTPSSVGAEPVLRVRPGVGPRRATGSSGVGMLAPLHTAAAAAIAGPLDRRRSADCPAGRCCLLSPGLWSSGLFLLFCSGGGPS